MSISNSDSIEHVYCVDCYVRILRTDARLADQRCELDGNDVPVLPWVCRDESACEDRQPLDEPDYDFPENWEV